MMVRSKAANQELRRCFDEAGLVVKDVVEEACGDERPVKRIEPHARTSQLRELIDASPDAWHALVSLASVKAECKRAEVHNHKPNWQVSLACFEPDPWQWKVAKAWASQVHIYFRGHGVRAVVAALSTS